MTYCGRQERPSASSYGTSPSRAAMLPLLRADKRHRLVGFWSPTEPHLKWRARWFSSQFSFNGGDVNETDLSAVRQDDGLTSIATVQASLTDHGADSPEQLSAQDRRIRIDAFEPRRALLSRPTQRGRKSTGSELESAPGLRHGYARTRTSCTRRGHFLDDGWGSAGSEHEMAVAATKGCSGSTKASEMGLAECA